MSNSNDSKTKTSIKHILGNNSVSNSGSHINQNLNSQASSDQNDAVKSTKKKLKSNKEKKSELLDSAQAIKPTRWSFIQNDLGKALDTWQELEKSESKPSPEEEQFLKIKTILSQLKDKLEQF